MIGESGRYSETTLNRKLVLVLVLVPETPAMPIDPFGL